MGVDLGAVPVQTPALAGTRPLGLGSELPRRHQERVQSTAQHPGVPPPQLRLQTGPLCWKRNPRWVRAGARHLVPAALRSEIIYFQSHVA